MSWLAGWWQCWGELDNVDNKNDDTFYPRISNVRDDTRQESNKNSASLNLPSWLSSENNNPRL